MGDEDLSSNSVPTQTSWMIAMQSLVEKWIVVAGLRLSPHGEFVKATALVDAIVSALHTWSQDTPSLEEFLAKNANTQYIVVRAALNQALGCIEQRRMSRMVESGVYWNVTCSTLQSKPFPVPDLTKVSNKKETRIARRAAKGLPPLRIKDPEASRAVEKEAAPPFTRYVCELLNMTSGPALLELKLFPNSKELSESFACFAAWRAHLADIFDRRDTGVSVVCVGDGCTPRTAALFAFRTSWQCISVDPLLREGAWNDSVDRLQMLPSKIEDIAQISAERVLLVLPHAHVSLASVLQAVRWTQALAIVAMPCCNFYKAQTLPSAPPAFECDDPGVLSPHRLIRIWRWTSSDAALPKEVPPPGT